MPTCPAVACCVLGAFFLAVGLDGSSLRTWNTFSATKSLALWSGRLSRAASCAASCAITSALRLRLRYKRCRRLSLKASMASSCASSSWKLVKGRKAGAGGSEGVGERRRQDERAMRGR